VRPLPKAFRFIADGLFETLQCSSPPLIHRTRLTRPNVEQMVDGYLHGESGCGALHVEERDSLRSALLYRRIQHPFKRSIYIQFAYSALDGRRTGAAAELVERVIALACSEDIPEISARAQDWNIPSCGGLVTRGHFQPIERVYYRIVDGDIHDTAAHGALAAADLGPTVVKNMVNLLSRDTAHLQIRTAGRLAKTDCLEASLHTYLHRAVPTFAFFNSTLENQATAFALCEPIAHPFKDFLAVSLLHCDANTLMPLLKRATSLARQLGLPEIGLRVFLDQRQFMKQLQRHGFTYSDVNYARWIP